MPQSGAALITAVIVCAAITIVGTAATLHFGSTAGGDPLDPFKVGGSWLIVGAIVARVAYNVRRDKAKAAIDRR